MLHVLNIQITTINYELLIIRSFRFIRYRFTQIAVDPQIKTPGGKTYDVIFVGTSNYLTIKTNCSRYVRLN